MECASLHLGLLGCCLGSGCRVWCRCSATNQQRNDDTDCHLHQSFGNKTTALFVLRYKDEDAFFQDQSDSRFKQSEPEKQVNLTPFFVFF
jgi:hypothetical protein